MKQNLPLRSSFALAVESEITAYQIEKYYSLKLLMTITILIGYRDILNAIFLNEHLRVHRQHNFKQKYRNAGYVCLHNLLFSVDCKRQYLYVYVCPNSTQSFRSLNIENSCATHAYKYKIYGGIPDVIIQITMTCA